MTPRTLQGTYANLQVCPCQPFDARGHVVISMLPELKGRAWDDVALGFVQGLRPSAVRVVQGGCLMDAQTWRVTVWMDEDDRIIRIEQEVEIGLAPGMRDGHAMLVAAAISRR